MLTESRPISVKVIETIAEREDVAHNELGYSLHDYIDPDVLDTLDAQQECEWSLRFTVADHTVVADSSGTVTVDGRAEAGRKPLLEDD